MSSGGSGSGNGSYCQCRSAGDAVSSADPTPSDAQVQRLLPHPRRLPDPPRHPVEQFDFLKGRQEEEKKKKSKWKNPATLAKATAVLRSNESAKARPPQSLEVSDLSTTARDVRRFCTCPKTIGFDLPTTHQHRQQHHDQPKEGSTNPHARNGVERKIRFWTKLGLGREPCDRSNSRATLDANDDDDDHNDGNFNNNNDDDDNYGTARIRRSTLTCGREQQCSFFSDGLTSHRHGLDHHHHHHHHHHNRGGGGHPLHHPPPPHHHHLHHHQPHLRYHGDDDDASSASCLSSVYHGHPAAVPPPCDGPNAQGAENPRERTKTKTKKKTKKKQIFNSRSGSIASSSMSFQTSETTECRNPTLGLLAKPFRLIACILSAQFLAVAIFFWMFVGLNYSFPTSASFSALLAAILGLFLSASKHLRCNAAILIPSVCTAKGRLGAILLIGGLLVAGPIKNLRLNIAEISRCLACSQEQTQRHMEILLRPYDRMMLQLNGTIWKLQEASETVRKKLKPLENGMEGMVVDADNGKIKLHGVKKTCKVLVGTAFEACMTGIHKAQDQCFEVMGALGTVYHHARVVLDRINPERWSNKQTPQLQPLTSLPQALNYHLDYHLDQRPDHGRTNVSSRDAKPQGHNARDDLNFDQTLHEGIETIDSDGPGGFERPNDLGLRKRTTGDDSSALMEDLELAGSDRDVCEPLDTGTVCQGLNDSDALCNPSLWAGDAIQEAINSTRTAIGDLKLLLQFRVTSEPYFKLRNDSARPSETRQMLEFEGGHPGGTPSVQDQDERKSRPFRGGLVFAEVVDRFSTVIVFLERLLPLGILVVVYSGHCYIREYNKNVTFDNYFIGSAFKAIDRSRTGPASNGKTGSSASFRGGGSLFPLKNYEKLFVIDATAFGLSHRERRLWRVGMCLYFLFFTLTGAAYLFDYLLYWLLRLTSEDAKVDLGLSGSESLDLVVGGNGVLVELLEIFIKGLHPSRWFETDERFDEVANETRMHHQFCLPTANRPNPLLVSLVLLSQTSFFLAILLKARLYRARNSIVGYFYRDKERARLGYLHSALVRQRINLVDVLHRVARSNHRRRHSTRTCQFDHCSCCPTPRGSRGGPPGSPSPSTDAPLRGGSSINHRRVCFRRMWRFVRRYFRSNEKCFVCSDGSSSTEKHSCPTEGCCGHYCTTCFLDMHQLCPLCLHDNGHQEEEHRGTSACTKVDV